MLREICDQFDVVSPCIDEDGIGGCTAEETARKRAEAKARSVASRRAGCLVIAADTLVECEGQVIGKPRDWHDAVQTLRVLTANSHKVVSGVCVIAPDGRARSAVSAARVRMRHMSDSEIKSYLRDRDSLNRAGAYALQPDDPNVVSIEGSPSAVMGLPLEETRQILCSLYPSQ